MHPQESFALLRSALADHQAGRLDEAERVYRRVLAEQPNHGDALHLLGVLESQRGRHEAALSLLLRAVSVGPHVADFHRHLGQAVAGLQRHEEALSSFARAIELNPREPFARADAAASLLAIGRIADGAEQFRIASELAPGNALFLGNYGYALSLLGRLDEALKVLERAMTLDANLPNVRMQHAEALWRLRRYDEALAAARRVVELAPRDPRALVLLGNTLQTTAGFEEAADVYRRAATLDSNSADARSNLALTLLKMGEAQQALEIFDQVLARWPGHTDALANRSLAILALGQLSRGFREYEARWNSPMLQRRAVAQPRWDGSDPRGRTVLLVNEQGLGDTIQFIRYAPLLARRGATVRVVCQPELKSLMETVEGVASVCMPTEPLPACDVYAPLASLPGLFGTTLENLPAEVPYLRADAERAARWGERFSRDPRLKVGFVWAGSPVHQNDRARSCRREEFEALAKVDGVTLYSLQKGRDAAAADSGIGGWAVDLGAELEDFADTAAVLQCLDLLIAVDTSVVHVAGALGRPVWTLLARGADWRWMLDREDSPGYPTMRLLRQPRVGDWKSVFERAADELAARVQSHQKETL